MRGDSAAVVRFLRLFFLQDSSLHVTLGFWGGSTLVDSDTMWQFSTAPMNHDSQHQFWGKDRTAGIYPWMPEGTPVSRRIVARDNVPGAA